MKSLVIITHGYPCQVRPAWLAFVREIAHSIARQGVKVTVIAPLAVHRSLISRDPFRATEDAGDGASVDVFRPRFISLSSVRIGRWNSERLTLAGCYRATRHVLRKHLYDLPDAFYGHFLYLGGAVAVRLGQEFGIPSFPAVGEGRLCSLWPHGAKRARRDFSNATAFLANSTELGSLLHTELGIPRRKVAVFPNGVSHRIFYPRDRTAMRRKYGLPPDAMLVCCVGYFTENKGPARVGEAIRNLPGVAGVFVGSGPTPPTADNIVFRAALPHEGIPEVMSACDVFVLPTRYEGCCSAILEAMSCGLPVISSTGAFNDDILNTQVALRVDPMDIQAIRGSIVRLQQNYALRKSMGRAAMEWSAQFDIDQRAQAILSFMQAEIARNRTADPVQPGVSTG